MKVDDFDITHVALTERGVEIGGFRRTRSIDVDRGPGVIRIGTMEGLWAAIWAAVAAAVYMQANGGRCRCGCTVTACDYCIGECFDG